MPDSGSWIWVNRWDEFQTYQTKRGKPWAPLQQEREAWDEILETEGF